MFNDLFKSRETTLLKNRAHQQYFCGVLCIIKTPQYISTVVSLSKAFSTIL